jgi:putative transposase
MPRTSRVVFPNLPHHVTQRGNRRGDVFFSNDDRRSYLALLREYTAKHSVEVLAYCLMPNHVHLVLVPATSSGLEHVLRPVHMRHAQRMNYWREWSGHLWQGRFFSSPLDETYLWNAIRYVELNPVRAGLVCQPGDYSWSSAAARCYAGVDANLTRDPGWQRRFAAIGDWSAWLGTGPDQMSLETLRRQVNKGLPCGSDGFVDQLEQVSGKCLRERLRGRRAARRK